MTDRTPAVQLPKLTAKQRDVLALVADNRTSKEIAGLLGISESAVNQRIEIVRARLGGIPRGELARLYRQEFAPEALPDESEAQTWKKIHLPDEQHSREGADAEGISVRESNSLLADRIPAGDGSQLSAFLYEAEQSWLSRDDGPMPIIRGAAIAGIVLSSVAIAAAITFAMGNLISGG